MRGRSLENSLVGLGIGDLWVVVVYIEIRDVDRGLGKGFRG